MLSLLAFKSSDVDKSLLNQIIAAHLLKGLIPII